MRHRPRCGSILFSGVYSSLNVVAPDWPTGPQDQRCAVLGPRTRETGQQTTMIVDSRSSLWPSQAMLKTLFEHFTVLYDAILLSHPTLASEHALKQEEEVYKTSNKLTYRNVLPAQQSSPDDANHLH